VKRSARRQRDLDAAVRRWFVIELVSIVVVAVLLVVGTVLYVVAGEAVGLPVLGAAVAVLVLTSLPATIRYAGLSEHLNQANARRLTDGRYQR